MADGSQHAHSSGFGQPQGMICRCFGLAKIRPGVHVRGGENADEVCMHECKKRETHRLNIIKKNVSAGQTKRTKVVRLLAEGTVEAAILKMQERKMASGSAQEPEGAILGQSEVDAGTLVNIMNDHPPLPK